MMRFLGIDLGTASLKLAIFDEQGRQCAASGAGYAIETPRPGWAQTTVTAWWRALVDAASRLPPEERAAVAAVGVAGQMHGVVLTDEDGHALAPAMLWPDTRATDFMKAWPEPQPNPVAPGMAGPLLSWVVQEAPEWAARTRWALQPKDWLRVALGGMVAAEPSDTCATALADAAGNWDWARIDALGLPRHWFAPVQRHAAVPAGALSADAARALGLPAGIPIATGAADTPSAALGSGLIGDGDALLTTGSGGQIVVFSSGEPVPATGLHRYRTATGQWYRMAAVQNVGVALETVRRWLAYDTWPDAYAEAFAHQASGEQATGEQASGAADEATRPALAFLPYLSGERSPWMNEAVRGGWLGLGLDDTRGTMMRAAFEGVAFSLRAGLDLIRASAGADVASSGGIRRLRLAGGGSVDPRWRQLLADALDAELEAVDCPNAGARGAALVAGLMLGHWREADLPSLAPRAALVAAPRGCRVLAGRYQRFLDLYHRTQPWFGERAA